MTALEFGILSLMASIGIVYLVLMKFLSGVWKQESVVSAKAVMVHVSHLRDKIEEATDGEKVIPNSVGSWL